MKALCRYLLGASLALAMSTDAKALSITPTTYDPDVTLVMTFNTQSEAEILSEINELYPGITLAYKANAGSTQDPTVTEAGPFASFYSTEFFNSLTDPEDATISHLFGAEFISNSEKYLLVKDGNSDPSAYLFDISLWDGEEEIVLTDFWVGRGAISHVSILTRGSAQVPDGGSTVMLLGVAFLSLIAVRGLRRAAIN